MPRRQKMSPAGAANGARHRRPWGAPPRTAAQSDRPASTAAATAKRRAVTVAAANVAVEIAPGVRVALRGAVVETRGAMASGFYVQCVRLCCTSSSGGGDSKSGGGGGNLHCILDCEYFLRPDCRSVSPNLLSAADSFKENVSGGLGLGFRMELL